MVHNFHCSRGGRLVALVSECIAWNLEPLASGGQSSHKLIPHIICQFLYAWEKTLNEDLFYEGSSASLPRLHTCENKVPFWDFKEFAVTRYIRLRPEMVKPSEALTCSNSKKRKKSTFFNINSARRSNVTLLK